jgi:hypothetical protein
MSILYRLWSPLLEKRVHPAYAPVLIVLSAVWSLVRFNNIPVGAFFDDAHYLVLAESLVSGQGYHLINYLHAPVEAAFPPGWPLLLVPITAVFPHSIFWPKVLSVAFWLGAIPLVDRLLGHRLPAFLGSLFLAVVALNPHLIGMAGTVMSESAFLFFTLLTLLLLQTWVEQPKERTFWRLMAIGLVTLTAVLIRTVGVALVAAVIISLLRTLRGSQLRWWLFAAGLGALALALLIGFNSSVGGTLIFSQLYSEHLAYLLPRWTEFLRFWEVGTAVSLEALANAVVPIFELRAATALLTPGVMRGLAMIVLLFVALGFGLRCRQMSAVEWYVLGYVLIYYVWIVYIGTVQPRIALPLIPFATFYWGTAVSQIAHWLFQAKKPPQFKRLVQLCFGLLLVIHLGRNSYAALHPPRNEIADLAAGVPWMAANLPQDAVVMTPTPVPDYLYLHRRTADYPMQPAQLPLAVAEGSVDYILIRPSLISGRQADLDARSKQILLFVQSNPDQFTLIHHNQNKQIWVYQVERKA